MSSARPNNLRDSSPDIRLYTPVQILMATVFGLPLAAGWLMAANYDALERPVMKMMARLFGLAATVAYGVAFFALAWGVPALSLIMSVFICISMYGVARLFQGQTISEHRAGGGRRASYLKTMGIAFLSMLIILAVAIPVVVGGIWTGALELPADF